MRLRAECRHPTTQDLVEVAIEAASQVEAVELLGRMEFSVVRIEPAAEPVVSGDAEAIRMTLRSIRDEVRGVKRAVGALVTLIVLVWLIAMTVSVVPG
jgi:hypothetical protein